MIGNILDNTTELYMIKYAFGEIYNSGGATLCKNPSDQIVYNCLLCGWCMSYYFSSFTYCRIENCTRINDVIPYIAKLILQNMIFAFLISIQKWRRKFNMPQPSMHDFINKYIKLSSPDFVLSKNLWL